MSQIFYLAADGSVKPWVSQTGAAPVVVVYPANSYVFGRYINNTGVTNNSFQIVNPAGSGVDIVIDAARVGINGAGSVKLYRNNTVLTTNVTSTNTGPLDTNGVAPAATFYIQVDITPDGTAFTDMNFGASDDRDIPELEGMIIRVGDNILFHCATDIVLRPVIKYHEVTAS